MPNRLVRTVSKVFGKKINPVEKDHKDKPQKFNKICDYSYLEHKEPEEMSFKEACKVLSRPENFSKELVKRLIEYRDHKLDIFTRNLLMLVDDPINKRN